MTKITCPICNKSWKVGNSTGKDEFSFKNHLQKHHKSRVGGEYWNHWIRYVS